MRIGVAVSGGGHRATAWAFGALAALVATKASADVVSVSSVSGGSIANGAVAKAGDFRRHDDPAAFASAIGPTLRMAATEGLFFPGRATRRYLILTLGLTALTALGAVGLLAALAAAGRDSSLAGYAVFGALTGGAVGSWVARTVRVALPPLVVAGVALGALTTWAAAALTGGLHGAALWAALACLALAWLGMAWAVIFLLHRRGKAVEKALGDGLFAHPTERRPLALADVVSPVNHVICATDLESGNQFYMAPRFLYGYSEGISTTGPSRVTLAAAVQASAALPLAFPPSVIRTGPFVRDPSITDPPTPPDRVVLSDGGVYDNMADQWESGFTTRLTVCPPLREIQAAADVLVVANASGAWDWKPFKARGRIHRELLGLARDQGIQYDVSTASRRSHLITRFTGRDRGGKKGLSGVIVMIDRVPMTLAAPFTRGGDDIARRAVEAVAFIEAQHSEAEWEAISKRNAGVATTLGPIGKETVLDLMEQSYVATMVGLYVLHGIGALKPFPRRTYGAVIEEGG